MNKNENPRFYGASDENSKDSKKNIKLKDVFIIPNNKKIKSDISKTDKELKNKVTSKSVFNKPVSQTMKTEDKKDNKKDNMKESISERNLKIKNKKKNKFDD